jgi:hypothetical protein
LIKSVSDEWIEIIENSDVNEPEPKSTAVPEGTEETVAALASGDVVPGDETTAALSAGRRADVYHAAADRCVSKARSADKTTGDGWAAAADHARERAEKLRDAAGGGSGSSGGSHTAAALEKRLRTAT